MLRKGGKATHFQPSQQAAPMHFSGVSDKQHLYHLSARVSLMPGQRAQQSCQKPAQSRQGQARNQLMLSCLQRRTVTPATFYSAVAPSCGAIEREAASESALRQSGCRAAALPAGSPEGAAAGILWAGVRCICIRNCIARGLQAPINSPRLQVPAPQNRFNKIYLHSAPNYVILILYPNSAQNGVTDL